MNVKRKKWFGNDTQALSEQIERAGSRLDKRKKNVTGIFRDMGARIRSGFASPRGLWLAGSAGFLVGEWMHRPVISSVASRSQPRKTPARSQQRALSKAILLLKFALDMRTRLRKVNSEGAAAHR